MPNLSEWPNMLVVIEKLNNNTLLIIIRQISNKLVCRFIINYLTDLVYWLLTLNTNILMLF